MTKNKPVNKKRKTLLFTILAILLALSLFFALVVPYLVDINNYRGLIQEQAKKLLKRPVSIEKLQLHLINGVGIRCSNIIIGDKTKHDEFIAADDMFVKFKFTPLFDKEIVIQKITLEKPIINIERSSDGRFNFYPYKETIEEEKKETKGKFKWSIKRLAIDKIIIRRGQIKFTDWAVRQQGAITQINEVSLLIDDFEFDKPFFINLKAQIPPAYDSSFPPAKLSLKADISDINLKNPDPAKIKINAEANIRNCGLSIFSAYYEKYLPYERLSGSADIRLDYSGNLRHDFTLTADVISQKPVWLKYPRLFTNILTARSAKLSLKLTRKDKRLDINIEPFSLNSGHFKLTGNIDLNNLLSADKRSIYLEAESTSFSAKECKKYIPFKVIPPKVSNFIINQIADNGIISKLTVKLDGEIKRIKKIRSPQNYNVLSAAAIIKRLDISGAKKYNIQNITGKVNLYNGKLVFKNMHANIENSRLLLDDSQIYSLYTAPYFKLSPIINISFADKYIQNMLTAKLAPKGACTLIADITGESKQLAISASANLTNTSYNYGGWFNKTYGQADHIKFKGKLLNWKDFVPRRITYLSGRSKITTTIERLKPLKLKIHTKNLRLTDIKNKLSGWFASGAKGALSADVILSHRNITGSLNLKNSRIKLKKIPLLLTGDGLCDFSLINTKKGLQIALNADLTAADYLLKQDLHKPAKLQNKLSFKGNLDKNKQLKIKKFTFSLAESPISITGVIHDLNSWKANLNIKGDKLDPDLLIDLYNKKFPTKKIELIGGNLDVDLTLDGRLTDYANLGVYGTIDLSNTNLINKKAEYVFNELNAKMSNLNLPTKKLTIHAADGNYKNIKFTDLAAEIAISETSLVINKLSLAAKKGNLAAGAIIKLPLEPINYRVNLNADKMDFYKLLKALGVKKGIISGQFNMEGNLNKSGEDKNKFAGLNGAVKIKITNGVIKKYGLLANIFSLISPQTIFKARIPDFNSEGFPYDSVKGNLKIKNGVVYTDDLILLSDAWKIVTVGKIDLAGQELDLKVYVLPLQAIDSIVEKIPLAGRILKGKNRGVLDTYYTVKGSFDSPEITARPITSLAENVLGIIMRTLSLPFTLFNE